MNVLFICSRNQWRSPTAEVVWRKYLAFNLRSAGASSGARRKVTAADIDWADIIFVMETMHQKRLQAEFRELLTNKQLEVMEIPDRYRYMDPELVEIFEAEAEAFVQKQV
ncbi:phosphotyrosine protein phosphatase [filamentous cyanobacterium CCP5]|nr:phosphotyrosine protein phosphatase [filamentous cyanobacterium CCP5]